MSQELTQAQAIAQLLGGVNPTPATKKEQPFINYVVYSAKGTYLGNFSLPENFSEGSKEVVLGHLKALGLDLRAPGASKKEITADDL